MKARTRAILVFLAGLIGGLLAFAPATVLRQVVPEDAPIELSGLNGSLWNGQAQSLSVEGQSLGKLQWKLNPLHLLALRLGGKFQLSEPGLNANGGFSASAGGRITLSDSIINARADRLPLGELVAAFEPAGEVTARIEQLQLTPQRVDAIQAQLQWRDAFVSSPMELRMGTLNANADGQDGDIRITISETPDSRLRVNGNINIDADYNYQTDLRFAAAASAGRDVTALLDMLPGQRTADGTVRVTQQGALR